MQELDYGARSVLKAMGDFPGGGMSVWLAFTAAGELPIERK